MLLWQENLNHTQNETDNRKNKATRKDDYLRDNMSYIADVEAAEKDLESKLKDTKSELEQNKKELLMKYEKKMEDLEKEHRLRMKVKIHEIEERKTNISTTLWWTMSRPSEKWKNITMISRGKILKLLSCLLKRNTKISRLRSHRTSQKCLLLELKKGFKDMLAPLA